MSYTHPSAMHDLPPDMMRMLAACTFLSLRDVVNLGMACRASNTATSDRTRQAKFNLDAKRCLWQAGPPHHLDDSSERRVYIRTNEWAAPCFGMQHARETFNRKLFWPGQCVDPRQVVLFATGSIEDTDETMRKLTQWMPEECREVVTLWVQSDSMSRRAKDATRCSVYDRHLAPFCNAQGVTIYECDMITDAGLSPFRDMEWLYVNESAGIHGDCVEGLVITGKLRCVKWWYYMSTPHVLVPTLPPMVHNLMTCGALHLHVQRGTWPSRCVGETL